MAMENSNEDSPAKLTIKLCLGCYSMKMLIPKQTGEEYYHKIAEMRNLLKHRYRFDDVQDLSFDEVEDAYDNAVLAHTNHHQNHVIKYPIYPTTELEEENSSVWNRLFDIDFCNGGAFVSDPNIKDHLPGLLKLLSSCVTYNKKKHTDWTKDPKVYDALPWNIIKFAKNSRVDSGYRLLERCVRHGHDPRMPSMFDNTAQVIQLVDGSLGFVIESQVPASMKKNVYNTTVAYTADDLLAVRCNCKSGSKSSDKVVCVHILPIAYKVTQLLYEDLAEHILVELAVEIW